MGAFLFFNWVKQLLLQGLYKPEHHSRLDTKFDIININDSPHPAQKNLKRCNGICAQRISNPKPTN